MRKIIGAAAVVAALSACGASTPQGSMKAADLGSEWPLTVDRINLDCSRGAVYFNASGVYYTLNGTAKAAHPDWQNVAAVQKPGMSVAPLIERGLKLCK